MYIKACGDTGDGLKHWGVVWDGQTSTTNCESLKCTEVEKGFPWTWNFK